MNDFKRKLDDMMGDTTSSEQRIQQQVRARLASSSPKRQTWQISLITSLATAIAILLFMTTTDLPLLSSNEGRGIPYDPLNDIYDILALKGQAELSAIDYTDFESLPTIQQLTPLQYIDPAIFTLQEEMYQTVIERQEHMYDEVVYEPGEVVRTMSYSGSHLPVYQDDYYEIVAVPGDRVFLQNGKLKVNGKSVKSELMQKHEAAGVKIVGGYEQVLNAREYLLLNHFPAQGSIQGAAIIPVHKIYGEVVGLLQQSDTSKVGGAEETFDAILYELKFRDGTPSELMKPGYSFPYASRAGEFFLEASYRTVTEQGDKAIICYDFKREKGTAYTFTMYKTAAGWQLGPNE